MSDESGFKAIVADLADKPMLGHTFVGYRRKGFDEFVALFKLGDREQRIDKDTCEKVVHSASPGTETYEACKKALKHWPC